MFVVAGSVACAAVLGLDDVSYTPGSSDGGASGDATSERGVADPDAADAIACDGGVATDPQNCGRCGHSCLGGACVEGECQTFVLATLSAPVGFAFAENQVFFSQAGGGGSIRTCVLGKTCDGGPGEIVLANHVGPLATDGTTLYWMDRGDDGPWSCPITGCALSAASMSQCTAFSKVGDPTLLMLFQGQLIWRIPPIQNKEELWTCPAAGGPARRLVSSPQINTVTTMTKNNLGYLHYGVLDGLNTCELSGCDGSVGEHIFPTALGALHGIATAGDTVYFAVDDTTSPEIRSLSLDGGAPSLALAKPSHPLTPFYPADVVVHDGVVYWVTVDQASATTRMERCDPTGTDAAPPCRGAGFTVPTFLDAGTTNSEAPGTLVSNSLGLFWFTSGSNAELRGRAW